MSMEALIPIIGKLQDVFITIGNREREVKLPQIVVVGSQSTGKSSVIEGIVGKDFLPRGRDIVTRCPLLIQLAYTPLEDSFRLENDDIVDCDWACFEHAPHKIYTDFEDVRKEIDARTEQLSGNNKGIVEKPIGLKIFSANVVNLTLIDLPGLTKVPVGDQPENIETQIRDMIMSYISNENALILAVTPANQDFANSEALKFAREVDRNGDRTLCVLTKLDLMDRGTTAVDVLMGKLIPVKLGIIGVVNRSQHDILANKSVQDCIQDEETFLKKQYPTLASENGIPYLAKTLNQLLIHHIFKCLPDLKNRISTMLSEWEKKLISYGEEITDKRSTLLQIIKEFSTTYVSTLHGTYNNFKGEKEIFGGARISFIFHVLFDANVNEIGAMDGLSTADIHCVIKNCSGIKPPILVPEAGFEMLIKNQMLRFETPMLECIDLVHEELARIVPKNGPKIVQISHRFPRLYKRITEAFTSLLDDRVGPTKEFVKNYLDVQLSYINPKNPEFAEALKKILAPDDVENILPASAPVPHNGGGDVKIPLTRPIPIDTKKKRPVKQTLGLSDSALTNAINQSLNRDLSSGEARDIELLENLIREYFMVVQKQVKDIVPKAIMKFLVNDICDNLDLKLARILNSSNDIDKLVVESQSMTKHRKNASEMLEALKKANKVLNEIYEIDLW